MRHPADLVAWRRWHESRHPVRGAARAVRSRLRPPAPGTAELLTPGPDADLLVAVEATHASVSNAVVAPLAHLDPARTTIVAPAGWQPPEAYAAHARRTIGLGELTGLVGHRAVLAAGHYTEIGAAAFALAEEHDLGYFVSQHGALTPFAPPLPRAAHLLAWSQRDGEFWTSGRQDVEVTVAGSQLLWRAGLGVDTGAGRPARPATSLVYLGQGHAAEISRARLARAALATCREHHAVYRPHPSERDAVSRAVLAAYARAGITVDTSGVPLIDLEAPIVSVFSTGVLEAAARGRDAWVDFPRPPAWLGEFWERYGMHRLADTPTPAPDRTDLEPARRIAEILTEAVS
ncbi:RNA-binding protein [Nocardioides exalbidus]|uniref:RNA-binding protein n=1 Tax=Nocardioides exalbidus TaxID=402596 RepID=UPI0011152FA5|nr:RNA-binding protein [Nocardioides exalbidus]